jgi:hypothetical protein
VTSGYLMIIKLKFHDYSHYTYSLYNDSPAPCPGTHYDVDTDNVFYARYYICTVTLGTRNWWLYKTDGRLGQIVLTGNVLQRVRNKLAA